MVKLGIKIIAILLILFLHNTLLHSYLTVNTNDLMKNEKAITNIEIKKVIEPELPNSYLSTGKIELEKPDTVSRRFDLVYFISIPVIFYLTLNFEAIKNQFTRNNSFVNDTDWDYIYFNTFVIPIVVAYFDNLYIDNQNKIKENMANNDIFNRDICFQINIIHYNF